MQPTLDYLRPSPVRGQLEPLDPNTLPGWRYIQTTDTPNELKVLLPPGTAAMYEQLLKLETLELSRKQSISWERIVQIRHLKDRMIRKCHRLSKSSYPKKLSKGDPLTFQTIMAPADFRVKEMEKWFREQHRRTASLAARIEPVRSISLDERPSSAALPPGGEFGQLSSSGKYRSLPLAARKALPVSQTWSDSRTKAIAPPTPRLVRQSYLSGSSHNHPPTQFAKEPSILSIPPMGLFSPPALPILLRSQRDALEDKLKPSDNVVTPAELPHSASVPSLGYSDRAVLGSNPPASSSEDSLDTPQLGDAADEHGVWRRRSCIKRPSIGDIPKTVSWADEAEWENQISKYANAAREAQLSGRKWEEIREIYLEQMSSLDSLQEQVSKGLDNLRIESEHLERVEKTISQQREALRATFLHLEQKQSLFQSKVQEVLQEADHVLSIAGMKREA